MDKGAWQAIVYRKESHMTERLSIHINNIRCFKSSIDRDEIYVHVCIFIICKYFFKSPCKMLDLLWQKVFWIPSIKISLSVL